jgi:hypothetical protein
LVNFGCGEILQAIGRIFRFCKKWGGAKVSAKKGKCKKAYV